jgi:hypothetical protein
MHYFGWWMVLGFFLCLPLIVDKKDLGWPIIGLLITPMGLFCWMMILFWPMIITIMLCAFKSIRSCESKNRIYRS